MHFLDVDPIALGLNGAVIRTPRLDDVPALAAGLNHYEVSKMLSSLPYPCPEDVVAGWVEIALARRASGNGLEFVIADDNTALGSVGFSFISKIPELGYWLTPSAQGAGLMTSAARAALAFAFAHGVVSIVSGAFADNPASLRVQHKLGFDKVGERRIYSLSRRQALAHIDTRLDRQRFLTTA